MHMESCGSLTSLKAALSSNLARDKASMVGDGSHCVSPKYDSEPEEVNGRWNKSKLNKNLHSSSAINFVNILQIACPQKGPQEFPKEIRMLQILMFKRKVSWASIR